MKASLSSMLIAILLMPCILSLVGAAEVHQRFVVAHRGLLLDAPENTLANFRACLELRIGFELDVRRSKDGHLVCIHDDTVDRTTDGKGRVTELTLQQLKSLDAGGWFDPKFRGQRIPTLGEVLETLAEFKTANVLVAVDIKGDDKEIETDIVQLATQHKVLDRLLMIGRAISQDDVRRRLRQASKEAHVACVANRPDEFATALGDELSDWVYVRYVPGGDEVARVHKSGKRVFIAGPTVSGMESANWRRAAVRGVDAILTDHATQLARQLRRLKQQ